MKKDKLKLYLIEFILLTLLFFALIVLNKINDIYIALTLLLFAIVTCLIFPKDFKKSIYKKQVTWLLVGFGFIYLGAYYLLGLISFEFYKSSVLLSLKSFSSIILPLATIIVSSEIIRHRLLIQDGTITILKKRLDLSKAFIFIITVLIDLLIYIRVYDLNDLNDFLTAVGFVLFASFSCNLLYNYISVRYGNLSVILYRLITTLYIYIIPIVPNIYIYFKSFLRMIYPYILYLVLELSYSKTDLVVPYSERKKNTVWITVITVIMLALTMLISCKFKYGILVVGSESMTGTIDVGDAVVFESYKNQRLKSNDIIIFEKNGLHLIHRIVKVENVNGESRYYTKGDANSEVDNWYVVDTDVVGFAKFKVKYIGYPSIWLRNMFKK